MCQGYSTGSPGPQILIRQVQASLVSLEKQPVFLPRPSQVPRGSYPVSFTGVEEKKEVQGSMRYGLGDPSAYD